jgi:NADPH2:quinone reductase
MKAVFATEIGGPEVLVLGEAPLPEVPSGYALVKIHLAGVNYVDVMERTDFFRHGGDPMRQPPFIPGTEAVGIVERIASDVTDANVGDRVGFVLHQANAYAEYASVPAHRLIPIPDDISDEVAAALLAPGMTAQLLATQFKQLKPGVNVLIHGASGGIGALVTQWAVHSGATTFATVSSAAKVDYVRRLGATHVIDRSQADFVSLIQKQTEGYGIDLVLNAVGQPTMQQDLEVLAVRGITVPFGITLGKPDTIDPLSLVYKSRLVAGFMYFDYVHKREDLLASADAVFQAYREGWLKPTIGEILPLAQAKEAHQIQQQQKVLGKLLLQP